MPAYQPLSWTAANNRKRWSGGMFIRANACFRKGKEWETPRPQAVTRRGPEVQGAGRARSRCGRRPGPMLRRNAGWGKG